MPAKKRSFWSPIIFAGLIAFMLGGYCGYGLDGMEHDSVHRRWNREEANHEAKRQEWVKEEEEHGVRKEKMHRETMVWEEKIADAVIRWEVARENLQDAQQKWEREKEEHDRYIKERICVSARMLRVAGTNGSKKTRAAVRDGPKRKHDTIANLKNEIGMREKNAKK